MASASVPVALETKSSSSRITKEGRRLTYVLEVVQKPERARACGQGAKSSSDRRPVDPPPIVDLRIFEGDERDGNDITFSYNANFFLFATLENARPMAHGRVLQEHINQPVLTGTPVAGMAYLDRPKQAGYFIFPDLSVRHEGRYRLAFSLFEETKDPKDADQMDNSAGPVHGQVHCRCEVKSVPFNVYSAKKFPGLTESTLLSRVVADQGCRVRIRRDVRMRKRPEQGSKEWDDYEDATADQRAARSVSPDGQKPAVNASSPADAIDRSRSVSNASNASYHPAQDPTRRSSHHDLSQQYQTGFLPRPVDAPPSASSHAPPNGQPLFVASTARPPSAPTSASSQLASQPPTPTNYNPSGSYETSHMASFPSGYSGTPYAPQPTMQSHHQPPPYAFPATAPSTPSNATSGYGFMPPPGVYEHASTRPEHIDYRMPEERTAGRLPPSHAPSSMLSKGLPPLQHVDSSATKAEVLSPMAMTGVETTARPPPAPFASTGRTGTQSKRSYSSSFDTRHIQEPLRAGARPNTMANSLPTDASDGSDEDVDFEAFKMTYRRADGSKVQRQFPKSVPL